MQWTLFKMVHYKIKLYIVTTEHCHLHNVVSCKSIQFLIEMYLLFPKQWQYGKFDNKCKRAYILLHLYKLSHK